jgi:hypothetical protein
MEGQEDKKVGIAYKVRARATEGKFKHGVEVEKTTREGSKRQYGKVRMRVSSKGDGDATRARRPSRNWKSNMKVQVQTRRLIDAGIS